jgi:LPS-assembly protein
VRSIHGFWREPGGEDYFLKPSIKSCILGALALVTATLIATTQAFAQQEGFSEFVQATHGGPLDITGKKVDYDYKTDTFVVTGDAVITQLHTVLTADQVDFLRRDRLIHAKGKVHIVDPLGDIRATEGTLNMNDESTVMTDATNTSKDKSYILKGSKVQKLLGQHYKVLDGFFTTCGCDPGTPDWSITGQQMNVNMGDTGTEHNGAFDVLGYPLVPLPYAIFPADTDRHTGFLGPRLGESGLRGFQLLQPWYWAINKSSDASVALDIETSQRVGLLAEYRLITGQGDYAILDGAFYDESLRSESNRVNDMIDTQLPDEHIPVDRYDFISMVRQHITPDLVLFADATTVSDDFLLRELNVWTLSRTVQPGIAYQTPFVSMRNADSDWGALYSYADGFAELYGNWNQDLIQRPEYELQTLPELLLSGRKELLGNLAYTDYDFQFDNFFRTNGQHGVRFDMNPDLTVPWRLGDYLYGYGQLNLRETLYSVSGHTITVTPVGTDGQIFNNALSQGPLGDGGFHSREMIYGSTGIGSELERIYEVHALGIEQLKHTIEPFATYSYIPNINQSQLPLFDQIDRVEPRSLFTYGVTSRFYAKLTPAPAEDTNDDTASADGAAGITPTDDDNAPSVNPFRARSYTNGNSVVEVLRLTLQQAYDTNHAIAKGASRFADLDMTANLFPTNVWSLGGQLGYSPQTSGIRNASVNMDFQPWWTTNTPKLYLGKAEAGSFLQISYDYIAPGPNTNKPGQSANLSQFINARIYYDILDRFGAYFAPSYDFVKNKVISAEYGVRIKSPCDCWAFDMGITKTVNPSETQYQFQMTLGGLGSVGQSPFGRNPFQNRTSVLPNYQ